MLEEECDGDTDTENGDLYYADDVPDDMEPIVVEIL